MKQVIILNRTLYNGVVYTPRPYAVTVSEDVAAEMVANGDARVFESKVNPPTETKVTPPTEEKELAPSEKKPLASSVQDQASPQATRKKSRRRKRLQSP